MNPGLNGREVRGVPIRMLDELEVFLKENPIEIAALTIPKSEVLRVAEILIKCGIKAIWNFAHVDLHVPKGIQVENDPFIRQFNEAGV